MTDAQVIDEELTAASATRWTDRELLFHLLLGYLVIRRLMWMVKLLGRLPRGATKLFATLLRPRDAETAWWTARYQPQLTRVVSPASFVPAPRVYAAWLTVRPRPAHISARGQVLLRAGLDPAAPVAAITAGQWHRLAVLLGNKSIGSG